MKQCVSEYGRVRADSVVFYSSERAPSSVGSISELAARESERLISDLFQCTQDNAQASSLVRVPFILLFSKLSTVTNLQTQNEMQKSAGLPRSFAGCSLLLRCPSALSHKSVSRCSLSESAAAQSQASPGPGPLRVHA